MDDLLKRVPGLEGGLGGVLGGGGAAPGGLGALGGLGGLLGGGVMGLLAPLLPALLGMLGKKNESGQSGLQELVARMREKGLGGIADSWVGHGPNEPISPEQANEALGPDKVAQLSAESGLPAEQVGQGVSAILPEIVNRLTPDGQLPGPEGVQERIHGLLGGLPGF